MDKSPNILIVDDEESMCSFMEIMLRKEGYNVDSVNSAIEAIKRIDDNPPDLVISDIMMPNMSGIELLTNVRKKREDLNFIMMTAFASVDSAVEALKKGASDYITKPFKVDEIKHVIKKLFQNIEIQSENINLKNQLSEQFTFDRFIGDSEIVQKLKSLVKQIAVSDTNALILGESGTGKDLIAKAIHVYSRRKDQAYITINCGAIPEQLLESELFGYKKGSFTGAIRDKDGLFKAADKGVLFLDEIGNLSLALQVKLLRAIEDQKFTPIGAIKQQEVDVRLIAATNANLEEEVKLGRFRADLFYRLNVLPITLPSLRERREDIPLLANYFLKTLAQKHKTDPKTLSSEAERLIISFNWPGNVRELENTITRVCLLSKDKIIKADDFPDKIKQDSPIDSASFDKAVSPTLESIEKAYIYWILNQTNWQKSKAAKMLGIDNSTLYRKINRYGLKKQDE